MTATSPSLKDVFAKALECPTPAERDSYLAEACGDDGTLRAQVESLLRADADAGSFLEHPAGEVSEVARQARGTSPEAAATTQPGAQQDPIPLNFLAPAQRDGALGRLGHYDILEVIGQGGMGIVFKAFDDKLHRVVAVKAMLPQLAASANARQRFVREAQAAAAVRDEHVIDIHAVEETPLPLPFLVMEYVFGVSLQDRLDRGRLQLNEILRIGMQTARGLAAAHAQGLVHRDVKPSNILLENGVERVKITDFGLARTVDDASLTQSGVIAGTPQFMSPEQARGDHVDHRADLFSLGSLLYVMCTGRPPFRAESTMAVLKRVCEDTPHLIRDLNPEIPDWLAALIGRLQAKNPAERPQTAAEVAQYLENGLAHLREPNTVAAPAMAAARSRETAPWRWRRWTMVTSMVAIALGLGIYLFGPTASRFAIGKARLEIQTDDSHVKVVIKQGNRQVALLDLEDMAVVDLDAGDYDLELRDGRPDLRLTTAKITLGRGGEQVVAVREDPDFVGEIRRFEGHEAMVRCAVFSANGRWIVSGSHDKTVRLWDAKTGNEVRRFLGHTKLVTCVAFSPDGLRILSASDDKTIRLWDAQTGKEVHVLAGHNHYVVGLVFTPDGRRALSASYDRTLKLWDLETGKEIRSFTGHTDAVWSVGLSSDGRRAVSGSWDGTARVWDVETGDEVSCFTGHSGRVWPVAVTADGRMAASGGGAKICLWDPKTAQEDIWLPGHDGQAIRALAFSADGKRLLSGGADASVRLWDVASGRQLHRFDGHEHETSSVAFSPDGRHALSCGGEDRLPKSANAIRLWRLPQAKAPAAEPSVRARLRVTLKAHNGTAHWVAFHPHEPILASAGSAGDTTVKLWDLDKRKELATLEGHTSHVTCVAFSPDGKTLASTSWDGTARLWDVESRKQIGLMTSPAIVWSAVFSPDGKTLATTYDLRVKLWNVATRQEDADLDTKGPARSLAWAADAKTLAVLIGWKTNHNVQFWEVDNLKLRAAPLSHVDGANGAAFTSDSKVLATGSLDRTIKLWDVAKGAELATLRGHTRPVNDVAISPDDKLLASADGIWQRPEQPGEVKLWDLATRKELLTLPPHPGCVFCVAFSPDGTTLATACTDGQIRLFEITR